MTTSNLWNWPTALRTPSGQVHAALASVIDYLESQGSISVATEIWRSADEASQIINCSITAVFGLNDGPMSVKRHQTVNLLHQYGFEVGPADMPSLTGGDFYIRAMKRLYGEEPRDGTVSHAAGVVPASDFIPIDIKELQNAYELHNLR